MGSMLPIMDYKAGKDFYMTITKASVNKNSTWLVKYYLFFWLGAGIVWALWNLLNRPDYIKTPTILFAGLANLFGPWTTIIIKASDFPNAGGAFNLTHAIFYTVILTLVIIIPLLIKNKWLQIICAVIYAPLMISWFAYGTAQLIHCAT